MGIVHPDRSIFKSLKGAEKAFVPVLADGLSDSWFIFTRQDLWTPQRPYEIDVLVMHEKYGFLAMEVKGGPVRIEQGEWYRGDHHFEPSPVRQSQNSAYKLRDHLQQNSEYLKHVSIPHAVVLPDVLKLEGELPPSCTEDMLLLNPAYENIEELVKNCIYASGRKHPLTSQQIAEFYRLVLPTVNFVWDPESRRRYSNEAISRISDEQIRALRSLDINHRVLVSGVAGSGKTRLAIGWAHESARSGLNTLLTCYNDPLGRYLESISSDISTLTVGPFLRTVSKFPGIPPLIEPIDKDERDNFWNVEMIEHLYEYADQSEIKFDTIVLDERQDFNDEWMDIIEKLLIDDYSKILCVADPNQDLYERGFFMPEGDSPWALAELRLNCRNTREIATFVRQFGGGPSASASPEGDPIKFVPIVSTTSMMEAVLAEIRHSLNPEGLNEKDIVVITGTSIERDLFYNMASDGFSFGRWEDRTDELIACETAKRAKGIEANSVILATLNQDIRNNEMYVGASRARSRLIIVGPESFRQRFVLSQFTGQEI
jgi:hypothetical protein